MPQLTLYSRPGLQKLKDVLAEQKNPNLESARPVGKETLQRLLGKMTPEKAWWKDPSFSQELNAVLQNEIFRKAFKGETGLSLPFETAQLTENESNQLKTYIASRVTLQDVSTTSLEAAIKASPSFSAGQPLLHVLRDNIGPMVLDTLYESVLKLGLRKEHAEMFVPIKRFIQETRATLAAGDKNIIELVEQLAVNLNTARNCLGHINPGCYAYKAANGLYQVADALRKGLVAGDLTELKAKMMKLQDTSGLASVGKAVIPLLEVAEPLQLWQDNRISTGELAQHIVEKAVPEQLMRPIRLAEKMAQGVKDGKLKLEGLPVWPGMADKVACISWLKAAMENPSLRQIIHEADDEWFTATLNLHSEDIAYLKNELVKITAVLDSFAAQDSMLGQLKALNTMPGIGTLLAQADPFVNDKLGGLGSWLKDDTPLSQLGGVAMAPGASGKLWQSVKLLDPVKVLKCTSLEALKKTYGVTLDAASATWLVVKKGYTFIQQSAYSPGLSLRDPVRLYRDLISFIREDMKDNPEDYKNATAETLLAVVAMVFKSFKGNHVPFHGNTAEWLKAYAQADPAKLTAVDKVLMNVVLQGRVVLEIKKAIGSDPEQARLLLRPLSEALKEYSGDNKLLRGMAHSLPYIPALCGAWKVIRDMNLNERKALHHSLQQQLSVLSAILRNNICAETSESLVSRQEAIGQMQTKLVALTGPVPMLQAELAAIRAVADAAPEPIRERIKADLELAESHLENLKNPAIFTELSADVVAQVCATQTRQHQALRENLVAENIPVATIIKAQLGEMIRLVEALPVELKLTDMKSVVHFAEEALKRLISSKDQDLISFRAEIVMLLRNNLADLMVDIGQWAGNQLRQLFTKEVELTPEEKVQGWFVMERELSMGQLAVGAAAGAASGMLLSAMFMLLSGEKQWGCTGQKDPVRVGDVSGVIRQRDSRSLPQATDNRNNKVDNHQGGDWKKWLVMAMPVVLAAAAGAGIAASIKPAIREKCGDNERHEMTGPGQLHWVTGEDDITKGIYLQPGESLSHVLGQDGKMQNIIQGAEESRAGRGRRAFGGGGYSYRPGPRPASPPPPPVQEQPAVKTAAEQLQQDNNIRGAWNTDFVMRKVVTPFLESTIDGARLALEKLHATTYVRKHVQNVIAKHGLTLKPNSLVEVTRIDTRGSGRVTAGISEATEYYTLTDLAVGKVHGINIKVEWDASINNAGNHRTFCEEILPGSFRTLFTTGKSHSVIMAQFNKEIEALNNNHESKEDIANYYKFSFMARAKELRQSKSVSAGFKTQLSDYLNNKKTPCQLRLQDVPLNEVVALRDGNRILAWDVLGNTIEFEDNENLSKKTQDWILDHLPIYTQQKCQNANRRFDAFVKSWVTGHNYPIEHRSSRLSVNEFNDIYKDITNAGIEQVRKDMDTLVKTPDELQKSQFISLAFDMAGALLPLIPASGCALLALRAANVVGIPVTKGLVAASEADNFPDLEKINSQITAEIIANVVLEGIPVSLNKAKEILGHPKLQRLLQGIKTKENPLSRDSSLSTLSPGSQAETLTQYTSDGWSPSSLQRGGISNQNIQVEKNGPWRLASTPGDKPETLYLFSHGTSINEGFTTAIPDGMTITFAAPHRAKTSNPGYQAVVNQEVTPYVKINNQEFTISAFKDPQNTVPVPQEELKKRLVSWWEKITLSQDEQARLLATGTQNRGEVSNYFLSPETNLNLDADFFTTILDLNRAVQVDNDAIRTQVKKLLKLNESAPLQPMNKTDILFLQPGKGNNATLEQAIDIARRKGYTEIKATHCRVGLHDNNAMSYKTNIYNDHAGDLSAEPQYFDVHIDLTHRRITLTPIGGRLANIPLSDSSDEKKKSGSS